MPYVNLRETVPRSCRNCSKKFFAFRSVRSSSCLNAGSFCSRLCSCEWRKSQFTARFWMKVKKRKNGCWLWFGSISGGYGTVRVPDFGVEHAHRVSWRLVHGKIPAGMLVCHTCDVPGCVNPDHLFLGTGKDNADDRDKKGRRIAPRGENVATSKLTEREVCLIKEMRTRGIKQADLASRFHTCQTNISSIVRGVSWKHVNNPPINGRRT